MNKILLFGLMVLIFIPIVTGYDINLYPKNINVTPYLEEIDRVDELIELMS